jgi:hypothetical protein
MSCSFKGVWYSNEQKSPCQHMSRNQCLLRYGRCSCDLYSRCRVWFPCISTQLPALRGTEVRTLSRITGFIRISWWAFSTLCCYTSLSHWSALNTLKSSGVPTAKNSRGLRSGDRVGQLTGTPRPVHGSLKVWFRCCLAMQRNWAGTTSRMNRMCCHWWRDKLNNPMTLSRVGGFIGYLD